MFSLDLNTIKQALRPIIDAQWRAVAGLAFMALAMAAIQYDEIIAPEVSRLSDSFGSVATDMSRRLASFTL